MNRSALFVAAMVATVFGKTGAIAQTNSPASLPYGVTQQLQWSGVDVDAEQFKGLRDLAVNAIGMRAVVDRPNFAVLVAAKGSLFEIYGPGSPDNFWRHGQGGLAMAVTTLTSSSGLRTTVFMPSSKTRTITLIDMGVAQERSARKPGAGIG